MKRFIQRFVPMYHGFLNKLRKLVRGNQIVIDDASDKALVGLRVFGKSTQDGTPTPDAPVEIVSVENPTVKVDAQSLSVPYTLHGIPVTAGGNYTDANGQQWICDEVDFGRGVYVQRLIEQVIYEEDILSVDNQYFSTGGTRVVVKLHKPFFMNQSIASIISNKARGVSLNDRAVGSDTTYRCYPVQSPDMMNFRYPMNVGEKTITNAKNDFNGSIVCYVLETPIETPLTAEQIEAYKSLHTNEPNTTILNNQNAWMEVIYIAK